MAETITVAVRWLDGYFEEFQCGEVRAGAYFLWMRLTSGQNRQIPMSQVRWFSRNPESHEHFRSYKVAKVDGNNSQ